MTYRDDHDAAIARADALAEDLRRAEAERDRLKGEVAELERERAKPVVAPAAPSTALVTAPPTALTADEIETLVTDLEVGGRRVVNHRGLRLWGCGAIIFAGALCCFASIASGFGLIALGIIAWVLNAMQDVGDHSFVLAALRHNPESIDRIAEYVTNKGHRWITIEIRHGESAKFAPSNPAAALVALSKHCPKATLG